LRTQIGAVAVPFKLNRKGLPGGVYVPPLSQIVSPGFIAEGAIPEHPIAVQRSHGADWLPLPLELPVVETYQLLANAAGENGATRPTNATRENKVFLQNLINSELNPMSPPKVIIGPTEPYH
jgi:hypothetical protein